MTSQPVAIAWIVSMGKQKIQPLRMRTEKETDLSEHKINRK
jgi:hypothetical protein